MAKYQSDTSAYATPDDGISGGYDFGRMMSKASDVLFGWASSALQRQTEKDTGKTPTETGQNQANTWIASNWPLLATGAAGIIILLLMFRKRG